MIDTESFRNEIRKDLDLISKNALSPDNFFAEHATYMLNFNFESRQKLGLEMWLSLLDIIKSIDEHTYKDMHKGTAFYHTGIMYLLNDKWTEGFEWLDYAFEQDTKNKTGIVELPATWTLSFDPRLNDPIKPHDYGMSTNIFENIRDLFQRIVIFDSIFNINLNSAF